MTSPRRLIGLLTAALLALCVPVPGAMAQGEGDRQYTDPLLQGGALTQRAQLAQGEEEDLGDPLSETPQEEETPEPEPEPEPDPEPSGNASGGSGGNGNGNGTRAESLPQTGSDARLLALAGMALLMFGTGLRLRTIPERF